MVISQNSFYVKHDMVVILMRLNAQMAAIPKSKFLSLADQN